MTAKLSEESAKRKGLERELQNMSSSNKAEIAKLQESQERLKKGYETNIAEKESQIIQIQTEMKSIKESREILKTQRDRELQIAQNQITNTL